MKGKRILIVFVVVAALTSGLVSWLFMFLIAGFLTVRLLGWIGDLYWKSPSRRQKRALALLVIEDIIMVAFLMTVPLWLPVLMALSLQVVLCLMSWIGLSELVAAIEKRPVMLPFGLYEARALAYRKMP